MGEPEYSRRHLTCLRAGEHPHTDVWLGLIEVVVLRQGWQAQNFGEVSERFKEHAWKVCVRQKRTEGSNPSLSASQIEMGPLAPFLFDWYFRGKTCLPFR